MNDPSIGEEGRVVRDKFRKLKTRVDIENAEQVAKMGGVINKDAIHQSEHYHACFDILGETQGPVPFFQMVFPTKRLAYAYLKQLGEESEPNTEWGQDGRIQIETPVVGRTGLFRVRVNVAACVARQCSGKKRSKIILPERMN